MKKRIAVLVAALALALGVAACGEDKADVASHNLSKAADNFEIDRQVTFINNVTGDTILEIAGRCNIEAEAAQLEVTCKDNEDEYRKHFLGLNDTTSYVVEQTAPADVSEARYRVTFAPQQLIPDIDFQSGAESGIGSDESSQTEDAQP